MARNSLSEDHIRRIESGNGTRGFQVHFSRAGKLWTKFFSDRKCGSKTKALAAARKHRDQLLKTLPAVRSFEASRGAARGYSIRVRKNRDGKVVRYISAAAAASKGGQVRKAFRITTSKGAALKAALAWRDSMIRKRLRSMKAK